MTPCSKVSYFYFSLVTTVLLFLPAALGCLLLAVIALFKLPVMPLVMLFFAMVFRLVVVQGYFNVTQEWRGRKARKLIEVLSRLLEAAHSGYHQADPGGEQACREAGSTEPQ